MNNTQQIQSTAQALISYNDNGRPVVTIVSNDRGMIYSKTLGYYEHVATSLKEMARRHDFRIISAGMIELTDSLSVGYYELAEVK